jgi:methylase of polypeptide subunit release factors
VSSREDDGVNLDRIIANDTAQRLRDSLAQHEYTVSGVRNALGQRAAAALDRNETTPALVALDADESPLATLTKLWPLQAPVTRTAASATLPLDALLAAGVLVAAGDEVRAAVDIRPYADDLGDWWVAADLTPGLDGQHAHVSEDHVLGVNSASSTLAQLTIRRPVRAALDLGTGCGVQALHLARHCERIVSTDVNVRALELARFTASLNGIDPELREGSLYEPVEGEQFDLIVTNPPFVVSPGGRHVYRDSGLSGDDLTRRVVTEGARHLNDDGVLQALANWMHVRGEDWRDRIAAWTGDTGCDAWAIEREVLDPAEYVELWLKDSGEHGQADYQERYTRWLRWFDDQNVEGIGFGWINLRAAGRDDPAVKIEAWPHALQQPLGKVVKRWFEVAGSLPADDKLELTRLTVAADVVQEQIGLPGEEHPEHIVLRQRTGLMRAIDVGTAEAGFVGACDGTLPVGALIDAVAQVLEVDAAALVSELTPRINSLVSDGFLEPVPPGAS